MSLRRTIGIGASVVLAFALSVPSAASSVAASAPAASQPAVIMQSADGNAGWASDSYLQANPGFLPAYMTPGFPASSPSPGDPSGTDAAVTPDSHFGCNQEVCIDVRGSSTLVSFWGTTANGGNYSCWRPYYQVWTLNNHSGKEEHNFPGPAICSGAGDGVFYDYQSKHAGYYPNKYSLCNVWAYISGADHISGYPCANIIQ